MKNPTGSQSLHPRFWTKDQEAIVNLLVKNRKKDKTLHQAFAKAARVTHRSAQAIAIRYYTKLRNADPQPAVPVNVHRKKAVVCDQNSKTNQANMSEHNMQLVSFVRTLFTRLTPAERADVIKNLV